MARLIRSIFHFSGRRSEKNLVEGKTVSGSSKGANLPAVFFVGVQGKMEDGERSVHYIIRMSETEAKQVRDSLTRTLEEYDSG